MQLTAGQRTLHANTRSNQIHRAVESTLAVRVLRLQPLGKINDFVRPVIASTPSGTRLDRAAVQRHHHPVAWLHDLEPMATFRGLGLRYPCWCRPFSNGYLDGRTGLHCQASYPDG
ncbi:MAG: hypothetical protein CMJ80_15380 [Planctomycetaceae bacterium]|nr:hypothetical protein [Planctomycetaceae bacterium]